MSKYLADYILRFIKNFKFAEMEKSNKKYSIFFNYQ